LIPSTLRIDWFVPPALRIRLDELNVPVAHPLHELCGDANVTVPLKLPRLVSVMVDVNVEPAATERIGGEAESVNPTITTVTSVVRVKVPFVPLIVIS